MMAGKSDHLPFTIKCWGLGTLTLIPSYDNPAEACKPGEKAKRAVARTFAK